MASITMRKLLAKNSKYLKVNALLQKYGSKSYLELHADATARGVVKDNVGEPDEKLPTY
jgi:hypothetical protein